MKAFEEILNAIKNDQVKDIEFESFNCYIIDGKKVQFCSENDIIKNNIYFDLANNFRLTLHALTINRSITSISFGKVIDIEVNILNNQKFKNNYILFNLINNMFNRLITENASNKTIICNDDNIVLTNKALVISPIIKPRESWQQQLLDQGNPSIMKK